MIFARFAASARMKDTGSNVIFILYLLPRRPAQTETAMSGSNNCWLGRKSDRYRGPAHDKRGEPSLWMEVYEVSPTRQNLNGNLRQP